jgi:hypothetical protein
MSRRSEILDAVVEVSWPNLAALPRDIMEWTPPASDWRFFCRKSQAASGAFDYIWNAVEADAPTLVAMPISDGFYIPNKHNAT